MIDYFIENLTGIKNSQVKNAPKLEEALGRVEIEPEGNFHDGLDDAVNTGYLIEKLELNPEYQLVSYEMPDKPSERLSQYAWRTICWVGFAIYIIRCTICRCL